MTNKSCVTNCKGATQQVCWWSWLSYIELLFAAYGVKALPWQLASLCWQDVPTVRHSKHVEITFIITPVWQDMVVLRKDVYKCRCLHSVHPSLRRRAESTICLPQSPASKVLHAPPEHKIFHGEFMRHIRGTEFLHMVHCSDLYSEGIVNTV